MKLFVTIVEFFDKTKKDRISAYSGQSSFFIIVSFFPFLMLLMGILSNITIVSDSVLSLMAVLPEKMQPLFLSIVNEVYYSSSFTLLSVTAVSAIWAAGKGFVSIIQGLNDVYDTGAETRNYFILRFYSTLYTIFFIIVIILTLVLLVFGNRLLLFLELHAHFLATIVRFLLKFKIVIFIAFLTLALLLIYKFVPNHKTKIYQQIPGALFAAIGWNVFSYVFSLYVDMSSGFAVTYGSLATLVFVMIWLYSCMNVLFFGAEINSFIAHKRKGRNQE